MEKWLSVIDALLVERIERTERRVVDEPFLVRAERRVEREDLRGIVRSSAALTGTVGGEEGRSGSNCEGGLHLS